VTAAAASPGAIIVAAIQRKRGARNLVVMGASIVERPGRYPPVRVQASLAVRSM
jgi:hypothetical protein